MLAPPLLRNRFPARPPLDDLDRLILKNLPSGEVDVAYGYDWTNRLLSATQGSLEVAYAYDALSRVTASTQTPAPGVERELGYRYDLAGRRTRLTWDDGFFAQYDHLVTGEVTAVRENGATSGAGVLATYAYDDIGRRASIARGNGTRTNYGYDTVSRLASLVQHLAGGADDLTLTFAYNPAHQIASSTRSNESYSFNDHVAGTVLSTANGLNQLTQVGGNTLDYDPRGNLIDDGTTTYTYTSENLLREAGPYRLAYDPLLRLRQVDSDTTAAVRFVWDGADLVAEHDSAGTLQRRYVHGPGMDEPLVEYVGAGATDKRWLHADERGSIVAASNVSGAVIFKNTYDEYGIPGAGNDGRFQYTGQLWIDLGGPVANTGEGLYYYKARFYDPALGRFMQTDPIGYAGGMNLYAYVGADPVNGADPSGLCEVGTGSRICLENSITGVAGGYSGYSTRGGWTTSPDRVVSGPVDGSVANLVDSSIGDPNAPCTGTCILVTGTRYAPCQWN